MHTHHRDIQKNIHVTAYLTSNTKQIYITEKKIVLLVWIRRLWEM